MSSMPDFLSRLKDFIRRTNSTYIIVENDVPQFVCMSFKEYERLLSDNKPRINITGNIHKDIIERAERSIQESLHKQVSDKQQPEQNAQVNGEETVIQNQVAQPIRNHTSNDQKNIVPRVFDEFSGARG